MPIQVQPTLVKKEITMLFLNILQELYYNRLLTSAMRNFTDMIMKGNFVDHTIKNGKIEVGGSSTKPKKRQLCEEKGRRNPSLISKKLT